MSDPRERFTGGSTSQGDDEDWPPDAPVSIADTTAVAKTHGDIGTKASLGKEIDIHELLKRHAFESPNDACDNHFEKNRPCPDAVYGTSDQYIILDSWVKDQSRSAPARGIFSWNFMVQGVSHDQNVGVKDKIDTVVAIQIGAFMIPTLNPGLQMSNPFGATTVPGFPLLDPGTQLFPPPNPGAALSYTFGFFPYVGRITIEMNEIGLQSISQRGGTRYHFEADVVPVFPTQGSLSTSIGGDPTAAQNPNPVAMRVVPLPGFDTYVFTEPIKDVHGLTLTFRSVDMNLPFPLDVVTEATAFTASGVWPYIGFLLRFDTQAEWDATARWIFNNIGLTRIFISGFKSGNAPIDNWINQAPGLLAQLPSGAVPGIGINGLDTAVAPGSLGFAITLAPKVNITPLVPVSPAINADPVIIPSATPVTVRFTTARVRVPMRLRRVVQRLTNYGS